MTAADIKPPRKIGETVTFAAHGNTFRLKRLSAHTFYLDCPLKSPRCRFADSMREIMQDVEHCLQTGTLPGKACQP